MKYEEINWKHIPQDVLKFTKEIVEFNIKGINPDILNHLPRVKAALTVIAKRHEDDDWSAPSLIEALIVFSGFIEYTQLTN